MRRRTCLGLAHTDGSLTFATTVPVAVCAFTDAAGTAALIAVGTASALMGAAEAVAKTVGATASAFTVVFATHAFRVAGRQCVATGAAGSCACDAAAPEPRCVSTVEPAALAVPCECIGKAICIHKRRSYDCRNCSPRNYVGKRASRSLAVDRGISRAS